MTYDPATEGEPTTQEEQELEPTYKPTDNVYELTDFDGWAKQDRFKAFTPDEQQAIYIALGKLERAAITEHLTNEVLRARA